MMASQASDDCFLVISLMDNEICEPDLDVQGRCRRTKGVVHAWWNSSLSVASVRDVAKVLECTPSAFGDGLFATV